MLFQTLEFTPLEFETTAIDTIFKAQKTIRIYSVGVWNHTQNTFNNKDYNELEFTPLEFETHQTWLAKPQSLFW